MTLGIGVMARAPSSGGKSRLASHLSGIRLCALREALLADTLRTVTRGDLRPSRQPPSPTATSVPPGRDGGGPSETVVFVTPGDAGEEVAALSETTVAYVPQADGDLGRRMCAAFEHLLQILGFDAAILVGSDIPLLTTGHLDDAHDALITGGVVLGPADDGGYYLIGMRTVHAELFDGVEWGTASVLTDTLRAADRAGIEARLIRAAYDVDTIDDLHRLEHDLQDAPPDLAPHVRAWFSERP